MTAPKLEPIKTTRERDLETLLVHARNILRLTATGIRGNFPGTADGLDSCAVCIEEELGQALIQGSPLRGTYDASMRALLPTAPAERGQPVPPAVFSPDVPVEDEDQT